MATTPNMNLTLPTPTVTLGPEYATQNNAAFSDIDAHDHSNGNGVKITPSGMNITTVLDFQNNGANNLDFSNYKSQIATLTGAANARKVYAVAGDLYYTNSSGTAIKITAGGALAPQPGSINTYEVKNVVSNLLIAPADTFVYLTTDTTIIRTITLPEAAAVAEGRLYLVKDKTGNAFTNNILIATQSSDTIDGQSSHVINSSFSTTALVGDGVSQWYVS